MRPTVQPSSRLRLARALASTTSAVAIVLVAALAGCGGSDAEIPPKLSQAAVETALATTPPALRPADRAVEKQANVLLPGDGDAAQKELGRLLATLKGRPVVVNLWGEWCAPCKKELPVFQRVALAQRGKTVFLGVATRTSRTKTEQYLASQFFLPYPSILDPDEQINKSVTGVSNIPKTYFYGPDGGKPFVHLGPYESVDKLTADIAKYAT
ncbi:MAG: TlpA disulfide reductase family protein [Solirubrobacteraceae bacterium]|nr:TlpA disulfide reductase family protein [Solirubrobacteraceae bacterium]